jgi:hypothetical protein
MLIFLAAAAAASRTLEPCTGNCQTLEVEQGTLVGDGSFDKGAKVRKVASCCNEVSD